MDEPPSADASEATQTQPGSADDETPHLGRRWALAVAVFAVAVVGVVGVVFWIRQDPGPVSDGELVVEVERRLPHDAAAFTQGLEVADGEVVESTGRYGQSTVRRWDLDTGEVLDEVELPDEYFAEGVTALADGRLVQLTWKAGTAIVRDGATLEEVDRFAYDGEGWGICLDQPNDRLVMSDGSAALTFRDPETFDATGSVEVTDDAGRPLSRLNELECVDGRVWANVWQTDTIVAIDPEDGSLDATVDASGLLAEDERADADVLNGIAALPDGSFLITGKLWPSAFVVNFVPMEGAR